MSKTLASSAAVLQAADRMQARLDWELYWEELKDSEVIAYLEDDIYKGKGDDVWARQMFELPPDIDCCSSLAQRQHATTYRQVALELYLSDDGAATAWRYWMREFRNALRLYCQLYDETDDTCSCTPMRLATTYWYRWSAKMKTVEITRGFLLQTVEDTGGFEDCTEAEYDRTGLPLLPARHVAILELEAALVEHREVDQNNPTGGR